MFGLGTKEIIIIAVVAILLFGAKRIPHISKDIADTVRNFKGLFKNTPQK